MSRQTRPIRTQAAPRRARAAVLLMAAATLAGCGGGGSSVASRSMLVPVASGPIASACMSAGRSGSSAVRCGCIQAAADGVLSRGEQRRGAKFFEDPHLAQEIRQSDRPGDEAFWQEWKAFASGAERLCRAT